MRIIKGQHRAEGCRFGIVSARFNAFITEKLVEGAVDVLERHGCAGDAITCVEVPGAFEVAATVRKLAASGAFDAVIALGCVIRGQTPHFEYVASQVSRGIAGVAYETGVPTAFGILTCDTLEQAIERAGGKSGNKGADAALCAIEMVDVYSQVAALEKRG